MCSQECEHGTLGSVRHGSKRYFSVTTECRASTGFIMRPKRVYPLPAPYDPQGIAAAAWRLFNVWAGAFPLPAAGALHLGTAELHLPARRHRRIDHSRRPMLRARSFSRTRAVVEL